MKRALENQFCIWRDFSSGVFKGKTQNVRLENQYLSIFKIS